MNTPVPIWSMLLSSNILLLQQQSNITKLLRELLTRNGLMARKQVDSDTAPFRWQQVLEDCNQCQPGNKVELCQFAKPANDPVSMVAHQFPNMSFQSQHNVCLILKCLSSLPTSNLTRYHRHSQLNLKFSLGTITVSVWTTGRF